MSFSKDPSLSAGQKKPEARAARPDFRFARRAPKTPSIQSGDVLEKTDIVELISEVVELRPRGSEFVGLCPFHSDSSPSFEVNGEKGIYSCWSCNAGMNGSRGGDAITFVRRYHGMSFIEALNFLAHRAGMQVPEGEKIGKPVATPRPSFSFKSNAASTPKAKEPNLNAPKEPLYALMQAAQNLFSAELASNPDVIRYLTQERGIDPSLLGKYRIGYAPDSFGRLRSAVKEYDTSEALFDAGLVKETAKGRRYDFFRDRLMFGVCDSEGRIIAFGGRRFGDKVKKDAKGKEIPVAKYLNSPETAIFNKREILFGLYEAQADIKREGYALMVEGYMDVLGLASQGISNVAACMGTALTEAHVEELLSRVRNIVFCFDGDDAGKAAGFRTLSALFPHLEADVKVRFLTLPDNLDPDEYARKHGKTKFLREVSNSDDLISYWEKSLRRLYPDEKNKETLWENAQELVGLLPESNRQGANLLQVAARLAGKTHEKVDRPAPAPSSPSKRARCSGLSSFVANEPSDRLYLAVSKRPYLAAEMRPELIRMQQTVSGSLFTELAKWQSKYDQAMAAGMAQGRTDTTDQEARQYEAIVRAAPSILSQYLKHHEREALDRALEAGELDHSDYLSKLRESSFSRPR